MSWELNDKHSVFGCLLKESIWQIGIADVQSLFARGLGVSPAPEIPQDWEIQGFARRFTNNLLLCLFRTLV